LKTRKFKVATSGNEFSHTNLYLALQALERGEAQLVLLADDCDHGSFLHFQTSAALFTFLPNLLNSKLIIQIETKRADNSLYIRWRTACTLTHARTIHT
jgi:hypothetical protein